MKVIITQARGREKVKWSLWLGVALLEFLLAWPSLAAAEGPPLVFIHGIKGSELLTADGDVQWITAWQSLGFSTPDLALETRFENGMQPLGLLHPGKILSRINVLPPFVGVDIYGPFLDAAAKLDRPVYQFSYDWRRDNLETMATFAKFLESIKARHGGQKVQVVAHSMGGLITLAVLNRNPELFDRIVFAGSPFGGGIGFLPDLHGGVKTGLNEKIVGPEVVRTFASVFVFFPEHSGDLLDKQGQEIPVDFYKVADWRRLKIGMYAQDSRSPEYETFLAEALARAKRFRELLEPSPATPGFALPKVLVVAGKSFNTLSKVIQDGPQSEWGWDFKSAPEVPGDSRVTFVHAMPPAGIPYDLFVTEADHTDMLNDKKTQQAIEDFLK